MKVMVETEGLKDIRGILAERGFTLQGKTAPSHPKELSALILRHLSVYNNLRKHFFHKAKKGIPSLTHTAPRLMRELLEKRWVKLGSGSRLELNNISPDVKKYLNGVWLEEYVWYALKAQGADEVMIGQKIFWNVDGVDGENEIDVIARQGESLTFVSCKTRDPFQSSGATEELSKQIYEVAYWKKHFLGPDDRVVLATTLDLVDEYASNKNRVPMVKARGTVLDVEVWGYEHLTSI